MNIDWSKAPEGATHWDPVDRNFLRQVGRVALGWINGAGWSQKGWQYPDDLSSMNRLIARPAWSGEGLPPVGTLCEFAGFNPEETLPTDPRVGDQVTVIAHFKSGSIDVAAFTFYAAPEFKYLQVAQGAYGCFRPTRTAEQIAAEERDGEVIKMMALNPDENPNRALSKMLCEALYDAGYRKQVAP